MFTFLPNTPNIRLEANKIPEEISEVVPEKEQLEMINMSEITYFWDKIVTEQQNFFPELNKISILNGIDGLDSHVFFQFISNLFRYFLHELILNGNLIATIIVLAIFSSVLETIHGAFEQSSIQKIAFFIVFLVLTYISISSFKITIQYATEAMNTMSSFMIALIPLLLALMATFGNFLSVAFFQPITIFLIQISSIFITKFIFPIILMASLLMLISNLNKKYSVEHLANLLKTIALATLGVFFTIFVAVLSVQGSVSAISDGVAMKTAKFVTANFIPVIGRTFIDATDTLLSSTLIIKNAIGIAGVFILFLIVLFPAMKILCITLLFKFTAAIIQPIAGAQIVTCLQIIGNYLSYILACLLALSFMFFLGVVIIIAASNFTILMQ